MCPSSELRRQAWPPLLALDSPEGAAGQRDGEGPEATPRRYVHLHNRGGRGAAVCSGFTAL